MQKLYIKHLGPIEECEINIEEFMVCTGPQASGKSTIAKSIFFFKNIKNILFVEYKKKYLLNRDSSPGLAWIKRSMGPV